MQNVQEPFPFIVLVQGMCYRDSLMALYSSDSLVVD